MKIIHGDCIEELGKLADESIDLLLTDPPYGDNMAYGYAQKRTIVNNEDPLFGLLALRLCYRLLKRNSTAYFFVGVKHLPLIDEYITRYTRYRVRDVVVWDKVAIGLGYGFRKQHEMILVLEKGSPRYRDLGMGNVLQVKRINTEDHPHKKPVELLQKLILQSSDWGDVVLDPFLGSGTTAVAAKLLGRRCIGIEKEAAYVQIAEARIAAANDNEALSHTA